MQAKDYYSGSHIFKTIVKVIGNVIFYAVVLTIIVAGIIGVVGKIKGKNQAIVVFGHSFFVVATNSMERKNEEFADFLEGHDDQIMTGDLVITQNIPSNYDLQVYDIVTFKRGKSIIIHRIVDIKTNADGVVMYKTRGDANNASDGWRSRDEFLGILQKNAGAKAGKVVSFTQSGWGITAIAASLAVLIGAWLVYDAIKDKQKPKEPDDLPADAA